jgi:hypothetical protein
MKNTISSYLRYVAKLGLNERVPAIFKSEMAARYGNAASKQNDIQLRTRTFLGQLGAPVGLAAGYQAAAAEAEKNKRMYSGLTLQNELGIIVNKWASRGLNAGTLTTLVNTIV